jgi:hypothetical protein
LGVWYGVRNNVFLAPSITMDFLANHYFSCLRYSRRICPGIHVAERELWLAISRLLWTYEIGSLPDESTISLGDYDAKNGNTPLPYRITLTPRHEQVRALLEAEQEVTLMEL